MISRVVREGLQVQGVDEKIAYIITTTPWGSSPTSVSVKGYDVAAGAYTDVTTTILSGSASVIGDNITTPIVQSLATHLYRIEVKFVCSGNTFEAIILIQGER